MKCRNFSYYCTKRWSHHRCSVSSFQNQFHCGGDRMDSSNCSKRTLLKLFFLRNFKNFQKRLFFQAFPEKVCCDFFRNVSILGSNPIVLIKWHLCLLKFEILDSRPVTKEKKGQFWKCCLNFFEILECPFLSEQVLSEHKYLWWRF